MKLSSNRWRFIKVLRWVIFAVILERQWQNATYIWEIFYITWIWHFFLILFSTCCVALLRARVQAGDWKLEREVFFAYILNITFIFLFRSQDTTQFVAVRLPATMLAVNVFLNFALDKDWHVWRKR